MAERVVKSHRVLVGLEIHVQLATRSKMFTAAANPAGPGGAQAEPNSQVDPVILGLPGVLPVINRRAVEFAVMVGLALDCTIARHTKWDRKSYYYPDLPKNYQISQYDLPLCEGGTYELAGDDGATHAIRIRRAHLEEDAGKLLHEAPGGYPIDYSIVDLNRAGTPLLEVVTEPDFSDPKLVARFAQDLQRLVQSLGVSEGQMQLGQMRFEPNINVHITDADGTVHKTAITEVKNLNSFSVLEKATAYEVQRQLEAWVESGDLGRKSTYGWDEQAQATFLQREKEDAHDYRYFPDPDLVPVEIGEAWLAEIKSQIGELPAARRKRYVEQLGLSDADATALSADRATGDYFDAVVAAGVEPKRAGNLIEVLRDMAGAADGASRVTDLDLPPQSVAGVAALVSSGKLAASKETARAVLSKLADSPDLTAEAAAADLGLIQSTDAGPVDAAIDAVIAKNPQPLQDYRGGKQSAIGALVGMVMKAGGRGLNPKLVQERLRAKLDG